MGGWVGAVSKRRGRAEQNMGQVCVCAALCKKPEHKMFWFVVLYPHFSVLLLSVR